MEPRKGVGRWLVFNGIGLAGVVVQLGVLAALLAAGIHYLVATALAVEAAVLHNFVWHERWTWRDRPAAGLRHRLARLLQFHLLNGMVSLMGNLVVMAVLTRRLGPFAANITAVVACSMVNFFGSDRVVFGDLRKRRPVALTLIVLSAALLSPTVHAASDGDWTALKPTTLAAWNAYDQQVEARFARADQNPFFAQDAFPGAPAWRDAARAGGIAMLRIESAMPKAQAPDVPDGRIHHWAGAVFVPGVTVDAVVQRIREHAGRESESYEDVLASRLISKDGDRLRVFMKLRRSAVITVTYNTEHAVDYRKISATRITARSVATKIAELENAGTQSEREKAPGADHGFLWRLNAYWRYEQVDGGVLIECESVSLSRGVPMLLKPFVSGMVERIARESLEKTLSSLRAVVRA